jgi:hypothetical protein
LYNVSVGKLEYKKEIKNGKWKMENETRNSLNIQLIIIMLSALLISFTIDSLTVNKKLDSIYNTTTNYNNCTTNQRLWILDNTNQITNLVIRGYYNPNNTNNSY